MFSHLGQRLGGHSTIGRLMDDLAQALAQAGPDICLLGGGNPAVLPAMTSALGQALAAIGSDPSRVARAISCYDSPAGHAGLRAAWAAWLRQRYGWPVEAQHVCLTLGGQSAAFALFNLLGGTAQGGMRRILFPRAPEYLGWSDVPVDPACLRAAAPLLLSDPSDAFLFRYDADVAALDLRHTGLVALSRPCNPTGGVVSDSRLAALAARCQRAGVPLLCDNAYGNPLPGLCRVPCTPIWGTGILNLWSASKCGLPGLRLGILVGDPDLVRAVANTNAVVSLAPSGIAAEIFCHLLHNGQLEQLCQQHAAPRYAQAADLAVRLAREHLAPLGVRVHVPEGGFFLWLADLPRPAQSVYHDLCARGVITVAGDGAWQALREDHPHRDRCLRVSLAASPADIARGLTTLSAVL